MSPPSHALMGLVLANAAYVAVNARPGNASRPRVGYLGLAVALVFGSIMPDLDSISRFWGTYHSTNVFIGHRGVTHSLLGVTAMAAVFAAALVGLRSAAAFAFRAIGSGSGRDRVFGRSSSYRLLFAAALAGGVVHLACDLFSPPGWGGIPVFFPLMKDGHFWRIGEWRRIGWFDLEVIYHLILAAFFTAWAAAVFGLARRRGARFVAAGACLLVSIVLTGWLTAYIGASRYEGWSAERRKQAAILAGKPQWFKEVYREGRKVSRLFFSL